MSSGFAVDVPVTDLDVDDETFRIDDYDDDNVSLDMRNLRPAPESFFGKVKTNFFKVFRRSHKGFEYLDTIEMFDRNRSDSSFAELGEFGPVKTRNHKKLYFHLLLGGFVAVLLAISLVVTRARSGGSARNLAKPILSNGTHEFYPTTILLSLDGFHPHYVSPALTPFLHNLMIGKGYGPPYMIPSNPTVTFANHYTLVTGLKPIYHGIVSNRFYDAASHEIFINTNDSIALQPQWWGGEPLWSTAARQGVSSAVHMWPGSEVDYGTNMNPMEVDRFNKSEVLSSKIDRLFEWLDRPLASRPELLLSYVPTIDTLGHEYGVSGPELAQGLTYVDGFLEAVYVGLEKRNLTHLVNMVVVSDHGMAPTSDERLIYLDDLVELDKIEHIDGWPLYGLWPLAGFSADEVFGEIMEKYRADPQNSHYTVHKKEDIENQLVGGRSRYDSRIAPIWIIPKIGYAITTHEFMEKNHHYTPKGVHGYNNTEVLMRSLFIATGPYFEHKMGSSYKMLPFENTEVYNIVCDSLNLTPAPNNGSAPSVLSPSHALPKTWRDSRKYPDTDFNVEWVYKTATVDLLWGDSRAEPDLKGEEGGDEKEKAKGDKETGKGPAQDDPDNSSDDDTDTDDEDSEPDRAPSRKPHFSFHDMWESVEEAAEDIIEEVEDFFDESS
ncbi:hypothetical protein KL906_003221 [Ogataea polymorpha]|uniref:Uncharacterized protein n=2 Tax=Ogataea polymorpha TaxID=460523 RepID=A0A9P8T3M5_9ASCO|nr:hypothetical protein KL906_003221 [Ogataea polymorpha]KAG7921109.1 hypothetical protein KL927_000353 [Ogataea polymorpha]KAG7939255.1 hypothetical protein KL934_000189 [Ogataea polymorpha]KAH3664876.1 hypothetical protein OGATHE_003691 [Ogataea polymorpha]